jgi:hypothetical protein
LQQTQKIFTIFGDFYGSDMATVSPLPSEHISSDEPFNFIQSEELAFAEKIGEENFEGDNQEITERSVIKIVARLMKAIQEDNPSDASQLMDIVCEITPLNIYTMDLAKIIVTIARLMPGLIRAIQKKISDGAFEHMPFWQKRLEKIQVLRSRVVDGLIDSLESVYEKRDDAMLSLRIQGLNALGALPQENIEDFEEELYYGLLAAYDEGDANKLSLIIDGLNSMGAAISFSDRDLILSASLKGRHFPTRAIRKRYIGRESKIGR